VNQSDSSSAPMLDFDLGDDAARDGVPRGEVDEATATADDAAVATAQSDDEPVRDDATDEVSAEQVGYRGPTACRVADISYRQLDYWARTGLVVPSVRDASGSGTQRLYSFRDIVVLKVVKRLLNAGVSLQNIRKAIETLRRWGEEDLANLTLISDGTTVYECRSAEEVVDLLQGGQGVFGIAIGGAFKEIQGSLADLPPGTAESPEPAPRSEQVPAGVVDELAARRARRAG
jgi:DNA-binding transcriptional MerR regulator